MNEFEKQSGMRKMNNNKKQICLQYVLARIGMGKIWNFYCVYNTLYFSPYGDPWYQ